MKKSTPSTAWCGPSNFPTEIFKVDTSQTKSENHQVTVGRDEKGKKDLKGDRRFTE